MFTQHNHYTVITTTNQRKRAVAIGTDIHLAVEVRNDEGEWEYVPGPIIDCSLCDGTGLASRYDENRKRVPAFNDDGTRKVCWYCTSNQFDDPDANLNEDDLAFYRRRYGVGPGKIRDTWFSDRNYTVFAVLGNVRNGFGFAGIETFQPLPVIADHRGVPDDATSETLALLSGEHSETWCTLDEVEAYDWTQDVYDSGVISLNEYAKLREGNQAPQSWSGGITGAGIVTLTTQAADALLAQRPIAELPETTLPEPGALVTDAKLAGSEAPADMFYGGGGAIGGTRYYVHYRWIDSLTEYTAAFRERMRMLREAVGDRECRLIFDFDS